MLIYFPLKISVDAELSAMPSVATQWHDTTNENFSLLTDAILIEAKNNAILGRIRTHPSNTALIDISETS